MQRPVPLAVAPAPSTPCATLAPVSHTADQLHALIDRCEQFRDAKAPGGLPRRPGPLRGRFRPSRRASRTPAWSQVVARYRAYRREHGGDPNTDGVPELLTTFDELSGPDSWAQRIGN